MRFSSFYSPRRRRGARHLRQGDYLRRRIRSIRRPRTKHHAYLTRLRQGGLGTVGIVVEGVEEAEEGAAVVAGAEDEGGSA